jgi:hypothetical protein
MPFNRNILSIGCTVSALICLAISPITANPIHVFLAVVFLIVALIVHPK